MKKRFKMKPSKSKKMFSKTARKTKAVNARPIQPRGGFRL